MGESACSSRLATLKVPEKFHLTYTHVTLYTQKLHVLCIWVNATRIDTVGRYLRQQQDSISMISGSVDEIMLEPNMHDVTSSRDGDFEHSEALPPLAGTYACTRT